MIFHTRQKGTRKLKPRKPSVIHYFHSHDGMNTLTYFNCTITYIEKLFRGRGLLLEFGLSRFCLVINMASEFRNYFFPFPFPKFLRGPCIVIFFRFTFRCMKKKLILFGIVLITSDNRNSSKPL